MYASALIAVYRAAPIPRIAPNQTALSWGERTVHLVAALRLIWSWPDRVGQ